MCFYAVNLPDNGVYVSQILFCFLLRPLIFVVQNKNGTLWYVDITVYKDLIAQKESANYYS